MTNTDACDRSITADGWQMACRNLQHRPGWVVLQREGNRSAFNGYRWTPSAYSAVQCPVSGAVWRTKAAYVSGLADKAT